MKTALMIDTHVLDTAPREWKRRPLWTLLTRRDETGRTDAELLSVYRDHGVVPKSSRDDNYNKPSEDLSTYRYVRPGDLVLNKMKTWQGSLAVSDFEGIVSPAYFVCSLSPDIYPRFAHHLLRSRPYIHLYQAASKGIRPNQWDLPFDEFRKIPMLVPPLEEQRRIADFLDAETRRIDSLVNATELQRNLLAERKESAFHTAVAEQGGPSLESLDLTPVSKEWKVLPLSRTLTELTNGYVGPTRDLFVDSGVRYIQSLHIKDGQINFRRRPYFVSPQWLQSRPRIRLRTGDVLIVQTGAIGEVAIVDPDHAGASCHALLIARANRQVLDPKYLWCMFRSSWGRNALLREQTGALHPHLEAGHVRYIRIPTPPLTVQRRVVARTEELLRDAVDIDRLLIQRQKLQSERRAALITAAVTGQTDVASAGENEPGKAQSVAPKVQETTERGGVADVS